MSQSSTRTFRGITARAAMMYLERLGGVVTEDGIVEGDGWIARVEGGTAKVGPTLRIDEVTIEFEGDDELNDIIAKFKQKAVRAGG